MWKRALILWLLPAIALAGVADLSWVAPLTRVNGTPYTNPAGYQIYERCGGALATLLATINNPATLAYQRTGIPDDGRTCFWSLTAFDLMGSVSARTNEASKFFPVIGTAPGAATNLVVTWVGVEAPSMALNALLIVADETAPTTGDALIKTSAEAKGFTVTYKDDDDAEDATGMDVIIVSESVISASVGTKYSTLSQPALLLEPFIWDDWLIGNSVASGTADATVNINIDGDPLAAGLTIAGNPHTITSGSGGGIGYLEAGGGLAGGLVQVIDVATGVGAGEVCGGYVPAGAALLTGNAPALRIQLGWTEAMLQTLQTKGQQILDAAIQMLKDEVSVSVTGVIPGRRIYVMP